MYPWASLRWRPISYIKDKLVPSVYATFDRNRKHSFDVIFEITAAGQFVGLMCLEFSAHIILSYFIAILMPVFCRDAPRNYLQMGASFLTDV